MASTWSSLKIELLETGQNSGQWGNLTNINLGDAVLGEAITGQATVDFASDADVTITLTDSATTQAARNLRLNITESSTGIGSVRNLILGSNCQIEKFYLINNTGTGAKTIKNTSGTGITVPAGKATLVFNNGTNVVDAASYFSSLTLGSALPVASGGTGLTAGTSGGILGYTATGTLASSVALTANALVLGAGAGATPTPMASLGTTTTVLHGNASGAPTFGAVSLTADVTGVLPTANGGTNLGGATPFTSGGVVYASSTSALATGSALQFNGTSLGIGSGVTPTKSLTIYNASIDTEIRLQSGTKDFYLSQRNATGQVDYIVVDNAAQTWSVNNTEGMRLTSTGLGIGTSSPAYKLDVVGAIRATSTLNPAIIVKGINFPIQVFYNDGRTEFTSVNYDGLSTNGAQDLYLTSGQKTVFGVNSNGTVIYPMEITATGNVGIGTSSPSGKLHVAGTGAVTGLINSTNGGTANLSLLSTGVYQWTMSADTSFRWSVDGSEKIRIDSSGNLLVGATSLLSSERLLVQKSNANAYVGAFNNTNNASGDQSIYSRLGTNADNTSSYHFIANIGNTADKLYIYGNGNVVNVNNSYGTLSDVKLKENIVDATPKLDDVMRLQVRNFNLKSDPELKQIGFVAQELEEIFPALIDNTASPTDKDNFIKSIKTSVLIPILVKAIQEQQAIIESLKARLDAANL